MKKINRKTSTGKIVLLEHITSAGGGPNFYTARAYQSTDTLKNSIARCNIDGEIYGDLGQLDLSGKTLEKSHVEVYRLVDLLFPELLNKGLKAEGYVKYSIEDIKKSALFTADH